MELAHVKLLILIKRYFKKPAKKVSPGDRRFLVMMLVMFFGMRRFGDIKELCVEDVCVLERGDLEIDVKKSKTDQEGRGFVFHISGERHNGFSVPMVVEWYVKSVGLRGEDYLFPRFRNAGGKVVAQVKRPVGYGTVAAQLKKWCRREQVPDLTLHSGRRGGCTLAVAVGLDKMTIKKIGDWSSDAVKEYFQPKQAGIGFTRRALRKL